MPGNYTAGQLLSTHELLAVHVKDRIKFAPIFLQKFFNTEVTFQTIKIAFDEIVKGKKLAAFCSPLVNGRVEREKGAVMKSFAAPYVKSVHLVDPARLIYRTPGEAIGGSLTATQRYLASIAANQIDEEEAILRRLEWMCVQLVLTGKVLCEGAGAEEMEIDFGRDADNTITLAGGAKWDTVDPATYDPTEDIEAWALQSSGLVSEILMDRKAFAKFRKFKGVKEALETRRGSSSSMELGPQLASVMQYKGMFGEYAIYVIDHRYENAVGVDTPFMPDNTVLMCGPYSGVMAYGAIQDGSAVRNNLVEGSRFAKHWIETGDVELEKTKRECAPCPVTIDADYFVTITVA